MAAISMEFIAGRSLARTKVDAPYGYLTANQVRPIVRQLCDALDYAHHIAKVVHRDLKPANVLITPEGQVKVTDFGIARSLSETRTRLTGKASNTSGTLTYMSPQQLLGSKASAADDIYALGATLYELLTGKPPFYTGDITHQILRVAPANLTERRVELGGAGDPIPAEWEAAILACLAKGPEDRPGTAGEVSALLGLSQEYKGPRVPVETHWDAHRSQGKARGGLVIATTPAGAEISVTGLAEVRSPASFTDVTPGKFHVLIRMPGYDDQRLTVEVKGSEFTTVDAKLVRSSGIVQVASNPPGLAFILAGSEKTESGITPTKLENLPTGTYRLTVRRPGWPDSEQNVSVSRGEVAMALAEFVGGSLEVTSIPPGAEVWALGKRLGVTPLMMGDIAPGIIHLDIRLKGYKQVGAHGEVKARTVSQADIALEATDGTEGAIAQATSVSGSNVGKPVLTNKVLSLPTPNSGPLDLHEQAVGQEGGSGWPTPDQYASRRSASAFELQKWFVTAVLLVLFAICCAVYYSSK